MAVKEWFRRLQPVQLYAILFLTTTFFVVELVASYVTHALTLLLNAYHMLCNIVALVGYIASIKYENESNQSSDSSLTCLKSSADTLKQENESTTSENTKAKQSRSEKRMKNTFGWARIDVVTMLICCVLLASFSFSLLVEACQTLIHIDHLDAMHQPLVILCIGATGILLNGFCYFLIGGYTYNQGVFLQFTKDGSLVLQRKSSKQVIKGNEELSVGRRQSPIMSTKSQGLREICRDVLGCVFVIVASSLVYVTESHIAKYIDPIFAIISAFSLFALSYPYMKESGLILLQTIPNHINIDSLQKELLTAFPDIVNVHDLHVWQLNGAKVVSTVHIIYGDPTVCARITDNVTAFFNEMGITHVTIQPEFCKMVPHSGPHTDCLIRCQSKHCSASQCCRKYDSELENIEIISKKKFDIKEIIPSTDSLSVDLKKCVSITSEDADDHRNNVLKENLKNIANNGSNDLNVIQTVKNNENICGNVKTTYIVNADVIHKDSSIVDVKSLVSSREQVQKS